eukprot:1159783-Pelagomonas_calceolata.AAC.18
MQTCSARCNNCSGCNRWVRCPWVGEVSAFSAASMHFMGAIHFPRTDNTLVDAWLPLHLQLCRLPVVNVQSPLVKH